MGPSVSYYQEGAIGMARMRYALKRLLIGLALAGGSCIGFSGSASAADYQYCAMNFFVGQDCYGARHSLVYNHGIGGHGLGLPVTVAVAALDTNLHGYGSWIYGSGYAAHNYAGTHLLYPWLWYADSLGTPAALEGHGGY